MHFRKEIKPYHLTTEIEYFNIQLHVDALEINQAS